MVTETTTSLWARFAAAVEVHPDKVALWFDDRRITFTELKTHAERCATELAARGIGRGDVVALQLPKRVETYALFLACLKLNAPYAFLDPKNPRERTDRILERIRPRLTFSTATSGNDAARHVTLSSAESGAAWLDGLPKANPAIDAAAATTGDEPAYIMFTSGSTGEPKGAVIAHKGILGLMTWARNQIRIGMDERVTNINPLHFDNSVFDLYCGLLNGATLVPIETAELASPVSWTKTVRNSEATVMFAVPTLFLILDQLNLLTPASLPSVRTFLFGGEGYPIGRLREFHGRFRNQARLVNVYGPTETSCICSSIEIDDIALQAPDSQFPPLGAMNENFLHAILDSEFKPVSPGEVGELWIGGPGVGLGYYGNREETAARFRPDPRANASRSTFYRSGDLVRQDERGWLWFQGRVDNQVKIRGHRIELEEIDLAVQSVPGVRRAVAVAVAAPGGEELNVAFMANHAIDPEQIHLHCEARLPAYMQPARVFQFDELPLNANGKVDRLATKALLAGRD